MKYLVIITSLVLGGCQIPAQIFACYSVEEGVKSNANNSYSLCARANNGAGDVLFGCTPDNLAQIKEETLTQNYVQDEADSVFVQLTATDTVTGAETSQTAIIPFVDKTVLELTLVLENNCVGKSPFPGDTCVDGNSIPIEFQRENCLLQFGDDAPKVGEGCDPDPRLLRTCPNPEAD